MQMKLQRLFDYIKEHESDTSLEKILEYAKGIFEKGNASEENLNRAYYGSTSTEMWIQEGFSLLFSKGYETWTGTTEHYESLRLRSMKASENIVLFSQEHYVQGGENKKTVETLNEEGVRRVNEFLEKNAGKVSGEEYKVYLTRNSGNLQSYLQLDEDVRREEKVIQALFNKAFNDALCEWHEIQHYYDISPYGGEDIDYFPKNLTACFFHKVEAINHAGDLDQILSHKEGGPSIMEMAYRTLVENQETKVLRDKMETYERRGDFLSRRSEILQFVEQYNVFAPLFENEAQMLRVVNGVEDDLSSAKRTLENMQKSIEEKQTQPISFLDRHFLKKDLYRETTREIQNLKEAQHHLQNEIESLETEHQDILQLNKTFVQLDETVQREILDLFLYRELSGNVQELVSQLDKLQDELHGMKQEVDEIYSAFRWHEHQESLEKTSGIEEEEWVQ